MSALVDPEATEALVEDRVPMLRLSQASTIKTPDDVIDELDAVHDVLADVLVIVRDADKTKRASKAALERRKATLKGTVAGSTQAARDAAITLETAELQDRVDAAEIAYDYAKGLASLAEKRQSAVQTQARLVESTMSGSGRYRP
ncbi:hypothetical protein [Rathayibacter sp. Leaf248]|uniref:hypothetical protein n=1 Tax=Rathayibacter sp. Leaf248 TaxID=2876555 RepID=UPI001E508F74|nr:hypothetical protein [Rathayibacter sp. Leaf248]